MAKSTRVVVVALLTALLILAGASLFRTADASPTADPDHCNICP
jgi:hypothetical protein